MKKVIIERTKKYDHIIGSEFTREYGFSKPKQILDVMDEVYGGMDGEQIEYNEEALNNILALKDGSHYVDQGDFEVFVTISNMDEEISNLVGNMEF